MVLDAVTESFQQQQQKTWKRFSFDLWSNLLALDCYIFKPGPPCPPDDKASSHQSCFSPFFFESLSFVVNGPHPVIIPPLIRFLSDWFGGLSVPLSLRQAVRFILIPTSFPLIHPLTSLPPCAAVQSVADISMSQSPWQQARVFLFVLFYFLPLLSLFYHYSICLHV